NGSSVSTCSVEFGPTIAYGAQAPCSPEPGGGSSPVAVSAAATGLTPGTTYHYRATAANGGGTEEGEDRTFTTLPRAPAVTAVRPNAGFVSGGTEVTISGTGFAEATSVRFGSRRATSFTVDSPTSITE